jgi:hypothetical protein
LELGPVPSKDVLLVVIQDNQYTICEEIRCGGEARKRILPIIGVSTGEVNYSVGRLVVYPERVSPHERRVL